MNILAAIGFIFAMVILVAYLSDIVVTIVKVAYRVFTVKGYDVTKDKEATLFANNFNK